MIGRTSDDTRYLVEGRGRQILLIHGVGMDLTMWDDVAAHLREDACVIRYDMLGHGDSAKPGGPYQLRDFVDQVKLLVAELQLTEFTLAGFSMGGLVAQGYALEIPCGLSRLVLMNTVYKRSSSERNAILRRLEDLRDGGMEASVEAAIDRWFTPEYRRANEAVVKRVRARMLGNDLESYISAYEVFAKSDAELASLVGNIAVPTLISTGEGDQRSTPSMALALASKIPSARAKIVAGQRHLMPLELPAEIADQIVGRDQF